MFYCWPADTFHSWRSEDPCRLRCYKHATTPWLGPAPWLLRLRRTPSVLNSAHRLNNSFASDERNRVKFPVVIMEVFKC